jgi:hypothetical protein
VTVYQKGVEWLCCTIKMWSGESVNINMDKIYAIPYFLEDPLCCLHHSNIGLLRKLVPTEKVFHNCAGILVHSDITVSTVVLEELNVHFQFKRECLQIISSQ